MFKNVLESLKKKRKKKKGNHQKSTTQNNVINIDDTHPSIHGGVKRCTPSPPFFF
jgi:hypothetical protein